MQNPDYLGQYPAIALMLQGLDIQETVVYLELSYPQNDFAV